MNNQPAVPLKRVILIGAVIFGIVIIGSLIYLAVPKSYITMSVAPDQASVSVDGGKVKTVKTGSTMIVSAGKHTYTVSHADFDSLTITVDAGNNETKELLAALTPRTDAASALLESDAAQAVVQKYYAKDQVDTVSTLDKNYPILKDLPIYARLYSIESCPSQKYPNDATKIALCVDMTDDSLEPYVRKDLASRGYNPDNFEIIYTSDQDEAALNDAQGQ